MQEVKCFFQGMKDGEMHLERIEDQINVFLKEHPNYTARSISTLLSDRYLDTYVIFDVREERQERQERQDRPDKKQNRDKQNNGNGNGK